MAVNANWTQSYGNKSERNINVVYIVNIMGADVLVTQKARASATVIFTMLNLINLVPTHKGLKKNKVSHLHLLVSLLSGGDQIPLIP